VHECTYYSSSNWVLGNSLHAVTLENAGRAGRRKTMTAILTSLLIFFGFAPAEARHDPCKLPAWVNENVALACDMDDAHSAGHAALKAGYTGPRTHAKFTGYTVSKLWDVTLIVTDRTVPIKQADRAAAVIGPGGGWVDGKGVAHGAYDTWTIPVASVSSASVPAGTLVSLFVNDPNAWVPVVVSAPKR